MYVPPGRGSSVIYCAVEDILELLSVFSLIDISALTMWVSLWVLWEGDRWERRGPLVEGVTVVSSATWPTLMAGKPGGYFIKCILALVRTSCHPPWWHIVKITNVLNRDSHPFCPPAKVGDYTQAENCTQRF